MTLHSQTTDRVINKMQANSTCWRLVLHYIVYLVIIDDHVHKHLQQVTNAGKNMSLSGKWVLVFKELKDKYDKISAEKGKNVGKKEQGKKKTECVLRSCS